MQRLAGPSSLNILKYGAVADAQTAFADCTLAVGTKSLVVSSAIFSSSDVGKIIGIARVAAPGYTAYVNYVTISSYVSSTNVILSANCSVSGTSVGPMSSTPCGVVWGTDYYAAQVAACAVLTAAGGGSLYWPSGKYVSGRTIYLPNNVTMYGDGWSTVLYNAGMTGSLGFATGPVVTNAGCLTNNPFQSNPIIYTSDATQTDFDITIRDIQLDQIGSIAGGANKAIRFSLAKRIKVLRTKIIFPCVTGTAMAFIGVQDVEEVSNTSTGSTIAHDHWKGCSKVKIASNNMVMATPSTQAINLNGVGTSVNDVEITEDCWITDNHIVLNGSPSSAGLVAIFLDGLGAGSITRRVTVDGNTIIGNSGQWNAGIIGRGVGGHFIITNNILKNLGADEVGSPLAPILIGQHNATSGASLTNPMASVAGSNLITFTYASHGIVDRMVTNGIWLHVPSMVFDGITFSTLNYYVITSVIDANTFVLKAPSNAVAGLTGGTGSYYIGWGASNNCCINNNLIIAPIRGAEPIIEAGGIGHLVYNNNIQLTDSVDTYTLPAPIQVFE